MRRRISASANRFRSSTFSSRDWNTTPLGTAGVRRRCDHSGNDTRPTVIAQPKSRSASGTDPAAIAMASGQMMAMTLTAHAIPRWKRAASDAGQLSIARLTSRPSFDVVQVCLTGQALQIVGLPR